MISPRALLRFVESCTRAGVWEQGSFLFIGWEHPVGCIVCCSICLPGYGLGKADCAGILHGKGVGGYMCGNSSREALQ